MAYRIFFSGLMVFVEHGNFKEVDVLLLNPCAAHPSGEHIEADHERSCLDRHLPQLTVKATDIAEWNLAGTVHGCGSRHFDLTGKIVFSDIQKEPIHHAVEPELDPYPVDPFGDMRHVSFDEGIVDIGKVLQGQGPNPGHIDSAIVDDLLGSIGSKLVAARVRLPKGTLTALAPLDNSVRQVVRWNIGQQKDLLVMCETVMFEPTFNANLRIELKNELGETEFLTLKRKDDVTVWITDEPRVRTRFDPGKGFPGVQHFEHFYALLPLAKQRFAQSSGDGGRPPVPELDKTSFNIDTPPCPSCLMHSDYSLG